MTKSSKAARTSAGIVAVAWGLSGCAGAAVTALPAQSSGNTGPSPASVSAVSAFADRATTASAESYDAAPMKASAQAEAPPQPPSLAAGETTQTVHEGAPAVLVYSASFLLSVYEVEAAQTTLKASAETLGGFVSLRTDAQLTLRVPAARFEAALEAVENAGKVHTRHVQALDVGDALRDTRVRLQTARAMRTRLESLIERANSVEDALRVEQELGRVVREIEQLEAELHTLSERIAYSTLHIEFRPEARPDLDDSAVFRLPFAWLDDLGLHRLLELAP